MAGFSIVGYKEIPVMPDGYKAVRKRDARGRFISGWEYIPDPDYVPTEKIYQSGSIYLINPIKQGTVREINEAHQSNKQ